MSSEPNRPKHATRCRPAHPAMPALENVRRILVCQLRQIGDVLLSTPSIALLARHYPQAQLHVYTEKGCAPMLHNNPHIHTLWELDKKALPSLFRQVAFYRAVAANGFDLVVNFQHLPRCTWVVALSRAPVRIGPAGTWFTRWLYTCQTQPKPAYAAAFKAEVLAPLGIEWNGEPPELFLRNDEKAYAANLLQTLGLWGRPFISLDTTHRHTARRWPARHYAALIDMIAQERPDMRFLLTYGPGEKEYVEALLAQCRHKENAAMLPDVQSLRHVAGCMAHACMHMGNCSAPRHMAVALGVPTFTILGASGTGWTFPAPEHRHLQLRQLQSLPCQNCNKTTCDSDMACLNLLTPDMVLPLVMEHLDRYGKVPSQPSADIA